MDKREECFNKLIAHIDELKISKKNKEELIQEVTDLMFEFGNYLVDRQNELEDKVNSIEAFLSEEDDYDKYYTLITCPYCNKEVEIKVDKQYRDVKCPLCNNIIELEWD